MRFFWLLLVLSSSSLSAAPAYVTDKLTTYVQSGPGPQFRIVKNLPSGQAVERIKDDKDSGYSLIKLPTGSQGWIATQFLSDQPPAHSRLDDMQKKLEQFGKERDQAQGSQRDASKQLKTLETKNKELNEQLATLGYKIDQLQQENQSLKNQAGTESLVYAMGFLLAGLLLSPIIAHLWPKPKRRSSW